MPSGPRTTLISSSFGRRARHPVQVRTGWFLAILVVALLALS